MAEPLDSGSPGPSFEGEFQLHEGLDSFWGQDDEALKLYPGNETNLGPSAANELPVQDIEFFDDHLFDEFIDFSQCTEAENDVPPTAYLPSWFLDDYYLDDFEGHEDEFEEMMREPVSSETPSNNEKTTWVSGAASNAASNAVSHVPAASHSNNLLTLPGVGKEELAVDDSELDAEPRLSAEEATAAPIIFPELGGSSHLAQKTNNAVNSLEHPTYFMDSSSPLRSKDTESNTLEKACCNVLASADGVQARPMKLKPKSPKKTTRVVPDHGHKIQTRSMTCQPKILTKSSRRTLGRKHKMQTRSMKRNSISNTASGSHSRPTKMIRRQGGRSKKANNGLTVFSHGEAEISNIGTRDSNNNNNTELSNIDEVADNSETGFSYNETGYGSIETGLDNNEAEDGNSETSPDNVGILPPPSPMSDFDISFLAGPSGAQVTPMDYVGLLNETRDPASPKGKGKEKVDEPKGKEKAGESKGKEKAEPQPGDFYEAGSLASDDEVPDVLGSLHYDAKTKPVCYANVLIPPDEVEEGDTGCSIEITKEDVEKYGLATCQRLVESLREDRITMARSDIWNSMAKGYGDFRRQGGVSAWRNRRQLMSEEAKEQEEFAEGLMRAGVDMDILEGVDPNDPDYASSHAPTHDDGLLPVEQSPRYLDLDVPFYENLDA